MDVDKLMQEIEQHRKKMTASGLVNGLTDDKTIRTSQELDKLLNLLYETTKNNLIMK